MLPGRSRRDARDLGRLDARLDQHRDALGDPVLEVENRPPSAVEMLRPEMRPGDAVDQLRRDPQPVAGPPHAALEHVAHAEFLRHLAARRQLGPCR